MSRNHERPAGPGALLRALVLSFALLAAFPSSALPAQAPGNQGPEAARIATAQGSVFVRGESQGDWGYADPNLVLEEGDEVLAGSGGEVTLEFPLGVFVTLSEGSRAEIRQIRPGLDLRLRYGTFHIVLLEDLHAFERARIEWPRGEMTVEERGCYRADVFRDGLARVATLRGEAIVRASGGRSIVETGEAIYVEAGGLPTDEAAYRSGDYDAYDRYVMDRYFSPQWPALPPFLAGYGAVGLRDLSRYGQWIYVPAWGKYAWRPRGIARSWRPFRDGRYAFTGFGWTWIPREPWGYAPCHYGNWGYLPKYGWLWQPGRRFAPAWVQWGQVGNKVGWAVIGPNGQIVVPPASIYGSPYLFMASKDFKAGKPVKPIAPNGEVEDITLGGDATPNLEPDPEAKIKAPRVKPGKPTPAGKAANQAEQAALKQSLKAQRVAEREAKALGKGKQGQATEGQAAPGAGAPVEAQPPAAIETPPAGGGVSPIPLVPIAPPAGGAVEPSEGAAVEPPSTPGKSPEAESGEEPGSAPLAPPSGPGPAPSVAPGGGILPAPTSPGIAPPPAGLVPKTPSSKGAAGSKGKKVGTKQGGATSMTEGAP